MDIRSALLQLRSELNMRQTDLANELGVSSITLCRWENGNNRPGRAKSLAILSIAASHGASKVCQAALKEALIPSPKEPGIDDLRFAGLDQINRLVNDSFNAVMVSDAENHDILYVNQQMGAVCGKPVAQASRMKCYEYLFGKNQPCEFCRIHSFSETDFTTGEYESVKTGRYYVSRSKAILWNERRAHIEYISDMTEFHRACKELAHHRELLSMAGENAQMWVFSLNLKTGTAYLDRRIQEALALPDSVPDFIAAMLRTDDLLSQYVDALERAVAALRSGAQENTEMVVQTKLGGVQAHWVRFRARTVERDASGVPETAVCSAQIIDEEIAVRTRVRFEHEQIIDSRRDLIGYVISNITRNTVVESRGQILDSDFPQIGAPYDEAVRYAASRIVSPEDQALFFEMHDRDALLARFPAGDLELSSDYQTMQPDGRLLWLHNQMKLVPQTPGGDVLLYEYSFSQHTERIMAGLLAASMQNGYEVLGAVSLLKNQVTRLQISPDGAIDEEALSFEDYMGETVAYCKRCVRPSQRQAFLRAVSLETLTRELQTKSIYRVSYQETGEDGVQRTKLAQYTLYDRQRQFCLLSVLDLEKLTASIKNVDVIHTEANE